MKRKFFITMMALCLICGVAEAQKYVVYSLMGKVEIVENGEGHQIRLRDKVTPFSTIHIPVRACVVLFDEAGGKQYTLKAPGQGNVKSLLTNKENSMKSLTKTYIAFMKKQISGQQTTT